MVGGREHVKAKLIGRVHQLLELLPRYRGADVDRELDPVHRPMLAPDQAIRRRPPVLRSAHDPRAAADDMQATHCDHTKNVKRPSIAE
jgi:hypothetical protein